LSIIVLYGTTYGRRAITGEGDRLVLLRVEGVRGNSGRANARCGGAQDSLSGSCLLRAPGLAAPPRLEPQEYSMVAQADRVPGLKINDAVVPELPPNHGSGPTSGGQAGRVQCSPRDI